jgi:hypothetical protein
MFEQVQHLITECVVVVLLFVINSFVFIVLIISAIFSTYAAGTENLNSAYKWHETLSFSNIDGIGSFGT